MWSVIRLANWYALFSVSLSVRATLVVPSLSEMRWISSILILFVVVTLFAVIRSDWPWAKSTSNPKVWFVVIVKSSKSVSPILSFVILNDKDDKIGELPESTSSFVRLMLAFVTVVLRVISPALSPENRILYPRYPFILSEITNFPPSDARNLSQSVKLIKCIAWELTAEYSAVAAPI